MISIEKHILVGDTHPEMIEIASKAAFLGKNFQIYLPLFFLFSEGKLLKYFVRNSNIRERLNNRILPKSIKRRHLRRPGLVVYFVHILLSVFKSKTLNEKSLLLYHRMFRFRIEFRFILNHNLQFIVYDTYLQNPTNLVNPIVICPSIHPKSINMFYEKLKKEYKYWPEELLENSLEYVNERRFQNCRVVTLSKYARTTFLKYGFNEANVAVIPIGPKKFICEEYKSKKYSAKVLFLGRFTPQKSINSILELASRTNSVFEFEIMGPSTFDIEKSILKRNFPNTVKFHFNPDDKSIVNAFRSADIFIVPSHFEGFSIATLEAMSYGLIPIVTKNSALPEILDGSPLIDFIIDPNDKDSLELKLMKIHNLGIMRIQELAKISHEIASDYSFSKFGEHFWENFSTFREIE
jgi:glycosyltransferase involved in cell wall biosynthesis